MKTASPLLSLLLALSLPGYGEAFDPGRLEKEVLATKLNDPLQCVPLENGDVLIIEFAGALKRFNAANRTVVTLGTVPVTKYYEVGMMGLAVGPPDGPSRPVYLFHCPKADANHVQRLVEYRMDEKGAIDLSAGKTLLDIPIDLMGAIHMGGGLWFDQASGDLLIGTGDNTPPIPELPVDLSVDGPLRDSFRSSANSRDLRGKILRIHPDGKGGYTIPVGNLFPDGKHGRPEIYAMGVRNGFRMSLDPVSKRVIWGDVGPNIAPEIQVGPHGYDEVNITGRPGNFGWPMFTGPNESYRHFDFATRKAGEPFDALRPVNESPRNTGIRELPPAVPAALYYPSGPSEKFPVLGSGGRSAMAGPVFHFRDGSSTGLTAHFEGALFIHDWMRNWIQAVRLDTSGAVTAVEPFAAHLTFRKPIDLKFGPGQELYVIEYGDKWGGNTDGMLTRVVYRRGNRPPLAVAEISTKAGKEPLEVKADASRSTDPDGDELRYEWSFGTPVQATVNTALASHVFTARGVHPIRLTITDAQGASDTFDSTVTVGNSPPQVTIHQPAKGGFFDWAKPIPWQVSASDPEDGAVNPSRVHTTAEYRLRRSGGVGQDNDPGFALVKSTTCFACHQTEAASVGPSYQDVSRRYANDPEARERLVAKIISGGTGVWGQALMPPHPQHDAAQARMMTDWILGLARKAGVARFDGLEGTIPGGVAPPDPLDGGVYEIRASYTDLGFQGVPPLVAETTTILHARRKKAAFADEIHKGGVIDVFEWAIGNVARLRNHGHVLIRDVDLSGIDRIRIRLAPQKAAPMELHLQTDSPEGPVLGTLPILPGACGHEAFAEVTLPITDSGGLHNLVLRVNSGGPSDDALLDIHWIEFLPREKPAPPAAGVSRILLIPTRLDHPWKSHMYSQASEKLAAELNRTPGVEALVCPDFDWPSDPAWLAGVKAIVYYSRPAGDILLAPERREAVMKLLREGAGLGILHWATGASEANGPDFLNLSGAWWNPPHSGLTMATSVVTPIQPEHPACRNWQAYELYDEYYLNMRFHPRAQPLVKVKLESGEQVVSWTFEREGGGRSFGSTLGHFQDHFLKEPFIRHFADGILWTAGILSKPVANP
jgi:cytochrome c